jgi:hypothetical protein
MVFFRFLKNFHCWGFFELEFLIAPIFVELLLILIPGNKSKLKCKGCHETRHKVMFRLSVMIMIVHFADCNFSKCLGPLFQWIVWSVFATMPLQPSLIFAGKAWVHRSVAPYGTSHGWYSPCFTTGFSASILDYQLKMTQNLAVHRCSKAYWFINLTFHQTVKHIFNERLEISWETECKWRGARLSND